MGRDAPTDPHAPCTGLLDLRCVDLSPHAQSVRLQQAPGFAARSTDEGAKYELKGLWLHADQQDVRVHMGLPWGVMQRSEPRSTLCALHGTALLRSFYFCFGGLVPYANTD